MDIRIHPYDSDGRAVAQALYKKAQRLCITPVVRGDDVYEIQAPLTDGASSPIVVRFLDPQNPISAQEDKKIRAFCGHGGMVIPVAKTAPDAGIALKDAEYARNLNAFLRSTVFSSARQDNTPVWVHALLDEIFAHGWLRRRTRKVFISYRRIDSAAIAQQLFREFTQRNFLVFLDEVSIEHGADFQAELRWWLNDTDMVLVLASPNLEASRWVQEELLFAQLHQIGTLAVAWPRLDLLERSGVPTTRPRILETIRSDQQIQLTPEDFTDTSSPASGELTAAGLIKVLARAFEQRADGIHRRLNDLVITTRRRIEGKGNTSLMTTRLGDISYEDAEGQSHFLRVLPFRPDAQALWDLARAASGADVVRAVYPEIAPQDSRALGLVWLAAAVRTVPGQTRTQTMQLLRLSQDIP